MEGRAQPVVTTLERTMQRTPNLDNISTKLQRIAELARKAPTMAMRTLAHHIDVELLRVAYQQTRKDGATGVDDQTAADYAANLESNLQSLLDNLNPPFVEEDINQADWIVISLADANQGQPGLIRRFITERPDLLRDKRVIVFIRCPLLF
jgi:hypothetical protein